METFTLSIHCDNAAFEDNPQELVDILRRLANVLEQRSTDCGTIFDSNGNAVGQWAFDSIPINQ